MEGARREVMACSGTAGRKKAAVLGPVLVQHRQGRERASAWGTVGQSVVLQPRRDLGCDEEEVLISLGDPKGL